MTSTRRDFAKGLIGGLGAVSLLGGCEDDPAGAVTADAGPPPLCTVYPEQTEGPFYLDLEQVRRDVREDRTGLHVRLELTVQRASDCAPLEGVAVDIWQCDAAGVYSGYPGQLGGLDTTGQTWLRGTQVSNAEGKVVFDTVYPGWYPGRTTHIHVKFHLGKNLEATTQIYFPEDKTAEVYATEPYAAHGPKDTSNAADLGAGVPALLDIPAGTASGVEALLTINVA